MATTYSTGLIRAAVTVSDATPVIVAYPADVAGPLTVTAISSSAGANKVEVTYASPDDLGGAPDWVTLSGFATVGTTRVTAALADANGAPLFPTALRVTRAAGDFVVAVQGPRK